MIRNFGWLPQKEDARDIVFSASATETGIYLPKIVDLETLLPDVLDQGSLGSCTGHGIANAVFAAMKRNNINPVLPSRLFIYYEERVIQGTVNCDCGAYIRDGIKVVNKLGVPDEIYWKYDIRKFSTRPQPSAYENAKFSSKFIYQAVPATKDMFKRVLAKELPIVLGFRVFESFEKITSTGKMPIPSTNEKVIGGHCVIAYRYDSQGVWCRNSYGKRFGKKGNFMIPWAFITSGNVMDCWALDLIVS